MLFRKIPLLILFTFVPVFSQTIEPSRDDYRKQIQALEERLKTVEAQLSLLLNERGLAEHSTEKPESISAVAAADQPAPNQPAPILPERKSFEMPPELIPEIGKIGAEVGVLASASGTPFKLSSGSFFGGFIDLPLIDRPRWIHGKISYEITVGLTRSKTQIQSTSNVAQVSNLAILNTLFPNGGLANVGAALTGTGPAPFPVTTTDQASARLLQVIPFSLKYATTALDRWRLRPYALAGFGVYVTIHEEQPEGPGVRTDATLPPAILTAIEQAYEGKPPFGSPLVAGQISQSAELLARGLPGGNGNIDIGLQTGGGVEFRISRSLSLGFDARFNKISGPNGNFATYGSRIGIHF